MMKFPRSSEYVLLAIGLLALVLAGLMYPGFASYSIATAPRAQVTFPPVPGLSLEPQLDPAPNLSLRVEDQLGHPVAGVRVQMQPDRTDVDPGSPIPGLLALGRTNANGQLEAPLPAAGSWMAVGLTEKHWETGGYVRFEVDGGDSLEVLLNVSLWEEGTYVSGTLQLQRTDLTAGDCFLVARDAPKRFHLLPADGSFAINGFTSAPSEILIYTRDQDQDVLLGKFTLRGGDTHAHVRLSD